MSQHGYAGFEIMHMKSLNLYCLILILRYETAIFALGTFLSSTAERTDHANAIDHRAVYNEIVTNNFQAAQQEALAALQWFLIIFENQFVAVGFQYMEEEKAKESAANHLLAPNIPSPITMSIAMRKVSSRDRLKMSLSGSQDLVSASLR
ncbi:regulatory-associated protein of mTOR [Caerostris extrusa]|uniref:Regulatory-associated protein of mTOR n=1 Tax=Caerostris extrusa TaxID=172846 RepID=A0AAV4TZF9_CAEEX|nr:regulatory-associated protein of mTOR [Caerostris extrusa]